MDASPKLSLFAVPVAGVSIAVIVGGVVGGVVVASLLAVAAGRCRRKGPSVEDKDRAFDKENVVVGGPKNPL